MFHCVIQPRPGHSPHLTPAHSWDTRLVTTNCLFTKEERFWRDRVQEDLREQLLCSYPSIRRAPFSPAVTDLRDSGTPWVSHCLSQTPGSLGPANISPPGGNRPPSLSYLAALSTPRTPPQASSLLLSIESTRNCSPEDTRAHAPASHITELVGRILFEKVLLILFYFETLSKESSDPSCSQADTR